MSKFAEVAKREASFTRTENGAFAVDTTQDKCLDLFSVIGSLRSAKKNRIFTLFADAYREDPLLATKILFYSRDIREGLGERKTFRTLLHYLAKAHPECIRPNIDLIGVFGRYDDLYELVGTPLEEDMWSAMKKQFEEDLSNMEQGNHVSLLAKWIKSADASSRKTKELGKLTAKRLGYDVYTFKRLVKSLRKSIHITESLMSANRWDEIKYSEIPSNAMMIHRNAFMRHDEVRFGHFLEKALRGEEKVNSSTLYPYDIVAKFINNPYCFDDNDGDTDFDLLEAQWRQLPNYVDDGVNALVMADVSGSMFSSNMRPIATSVGLAIYFAERNHGAFHNLFMTFSNSPKFVTLKGETLAQKVENVSKADWGFSTNLEDAFLKVLEVAVNNHVPQEDLPKSLIVISDMEINKAASGSGLFYDVMKKKYAEYGYKIPGVVFWNVESRHNIFHVDKDRKGVQLFSGQSASTFKHLIKSIDMTPVEAMLEAINQERYDCIRVDGF